MSINFIDIRNTFYFIPEKFDADRFFIFIAGNHFHNVAAHTECTAGKFIIIACIQQIDKALEQSLTAEAIAFFNHECLADPFIRCTDSVYAADRCDDDNIGITA